MECVAEMDDPHWDEPLTPKEATNRKRAIKAKEAERATLRDALEHSTPKSIIGTMAFCGDMSLKFIEDGLANENPEVRAKAQEEIPRLIAELGKLNTVQVERSA